MNELLKARIREQQIERELEEQRKNEMEAQDEEDEDDEDEESSEEEDEYTAMQRRVAESGSKLCLNTNHKGTQILFGGVEMTGMGILKANLLSVQVMCVRCSSKCDITVEPGRSNTITCKNCSVNIHVKYRPEMLHPHSNSLGYFDFVNAEGYDLLPSSFWYYRFLFYIRYVRRYLYPPACIVCIWVTGLPASSVFMKRLLKIYCVVFTVKTIVTYVIQSSHYLLKVCN